MKLEPFIDVDEFVVEITADITDVTEAMRTHTARAAHYSMQATKAKRQKDRVALTVKSVEAALKKSYRKKLIEAANELAEETQSKPERITADMVETEVALDPNMRKWLEMQIDADEIYAVCKAAYDAFYTRREMLTSVGHMTRAQLQTGLIIEDAKKSAESYKARRAARKGGANQG